MEEYVFGHVNHGGVTRDNLKIISDKPTNLTGAVSIERKYPDSHITDNFNIIEKYRSIKRDGKYYEWYLINNHYRYTGKYTPQISSTETNITDLEIQSIEHDQSITDLEIENIELSNRVIQLEEAIENIKEAVKNV